MYKRLLSLIPFTTANLFLLATFGFRLNASIILSDDFSQPNADTGRHAPYNVYRTQIWNGTPAKTGLPPNEDTRPNQTNLGVDLPGGVWQFGGGAGHDYDACEVGNLARYGSVGIKLTGTPYLAPYACLHNDENIALPFNGYNAATKLTVSVYVCPEGGDCYVGFDSAPKTPNNLSGLKVDQQGGVSLIVNGRQVGSTVPFTGTFNKITARRLTFTIDTATGGISHVTLQDSASNYDFATAAFTEAATNYAALATPSGSGRAIFAALQISSEDSSAPDPTLVPFGIATSASSLHACAGWLPAVSSTGVQWLRGFDTFGDIHPTNGAWNWTNVDAELKTAADNNMEVSGLFFYGANWIPTISGLPTSNLPAWSNYVFSLVSHVAGKVKYWEVWNEPPNFTNNAGTPADYASIVTAAYNAAHQADPNCAVGLAAQSNNVNWLDQTILAGAADHFDYITVHPYEMLGTVDGGGEGEFMSIVPTIRKMLLARDPSRANVPIWFTEIGESIGHVNGTTTVTAASQARDLVKAYAMGLAQGVACIDWFEGHDGDSGPMGLIDAQGNARPACTAMAQLIQQLSSTPTYLGWILLNNKDYGFVFQGASGAVLITWAPPGVTDTVNFGQTVELIDPTTGAGTQSNLLSLTNAPVLVTGIPASLVAVARNDQDRPFPWGGDFTTASSISATMGAPNNDSGLHQLYPDTTSAAVTAFGGPARDCSVASSQCFTVDPNFLSYTPRPIRITAVVRRDAANDNAGFNLKYESVSGWKSTGTWTSVPSNGQWSTVSWTITDPQFVGKWGYNFALDSDSKALSKYYLQSVTVTNL